MSIFNIEAERSVIGALLLNPANLDEVSEQITANDFYDTKNKIIFEAMLKLREENIFIDLLTVSEKVKGKVDKTEKKEDEYNSSFGVIIDFSKVTDDYLVELAHNTYSVSNIIEHAKIISEYSKKRALKYLLDDLTSHIEKNKEINAESLISMAESKIFSLGRNGNMGRDGAQKVSEIYPAIIEELTIRSLSGESIRGLKTGFDELDKAINGLNRSSVIVLAARTSMGKTTLALNIAENVAITNNKTTVIFSNEMPKEQLLMKITSSVGKIDADIINSGKLNVSDWDKISTVTEQMIGANLFIDDSPSITVAQIGSRARRLCRESDLSLIVVDYLQLLKAADKYTNKTYEIGEISRSLKLLAMELKLPILVVAQLNRDPDKRIDKRPFMSDLRDSGSIEQDADVVLLLFQDFVYSQDNSKKGDAELIISKNRFGATGTIKLAFNGSYSRFDNFSYY